MPGLDGVLKQRMTTAMPHVQRIGSLFERSDWRICCLEEELLAELDERADDDIRRLELV